MLKLELIPTSLANRLLFFMVARLIGGVVAFVVFLFFHVFVGFVLFVVFLFLTVAYYFYLHRLALAVFLLAQQAKTSAEG